MIRYDQTFNDKIKIKIMKRLVYVCVAGTITIVSLVAAFLFSSASPDEAPVQHQTKNTRGISPPIHVHFEPDIFVEQTSSNIQRNLRDAFDWQRAAKITACTKNPEEERQNRGDGSSLNFFNFEEGRCQPVPGWATPLLPHETSVEEMFCRDDSVFGNRGWHILGRSATNMSTTNLFTSSKLLQHGEEERNELKHLDRRYSRFTHQTSSFLFRQWREWEPHPKPVDHHEVRPGVWDDLVRATVALKQKYRMRTYHDVDAENLFRVENFCLSPNNGLAGFTPSLRPYKGLEDTRGHYHTEQYFGDFFSNVQYLSTSHFTRAGSAPRFFDERPVFFVPLSSRIRWNIAHMSHRVWAMLGILNINRPFSVGNNDDGITNKTTTTASSSSSSKTRQLKPLIVFVNEEEYPAHVMLPHDTKTTAMGFFFRIFDLPWAVVHSSSPSNKTARDEYVSRMEKLIGFQKKKKKDDSKNNATDSSIHNVFYHFDEDDDGNDNDAQVCFSNGVAFQNCYPSSSSSSSTSSPCSRFSDVEVESYSFGNWVPATRNRVEMLRLYRQGVHHCIDRFDSSQRGRDHDSTFFHESPSTAALPRIFFDVRTGAHSTTFASRRSLHGLTSVILPHLQDELVAQGFASSVIFREPWRGSRTQYLDDLRGSDILIGVHGGAFAQAPLMKPKSMLVELTTPDFYEIGSGFAVQMPHIWFGAAANGSQLDHWFFEIAPQLRWEFYVAPEYLTEVVLKQACCRWLFSHGRLADAGSSPLVADDGNSDNEKNKKMQHFCTDRFGKQSLSKTRHFEKYKRFSYIPSHMQSILKSLFNFSDLTTDNCQRIMLQVIELKTRFGEAAIRNGEVRFGSQHPELWRELLAVIGAWGWKQGSIRVAHDSFHIDRIPAFPIRAEDGTTPLWQGTIGTTTTTTVRAVEKYFAWYELLLCLRHHRGGNNGDPPGSTTTTTTSTSRSGGHADDSNSLCLYFVDTTRALKLPASPTSSHVALLPPRQDKHSLRDEFYRKQTRLADESILLARVREKMMMQEKKGTMRGRKRSDGTTAAAERNFLSSFAERHGWFVAGGVLLGVIGVVLLVVACYLSSSQQHSNVFGLRKSAGGRKAQR